MLGKAPWYSSLEEFRNLFHKLFVILEDAAVSGVTIEGSEFGSWQTSSQVDSVTAGHHSIVLTVDDQDRLLNARQGGRLLTPPSMDGLELPTERREGTDLSRLSVHSFNRSKNCRAASRPFAVRVKNR